MKLNKTEFMCFIQEVANSILNGKPLKLIDQFTYLDSNILSIESDVNMDRYCQIICHKEIWSIR